MNLWEYYKKTLSKHDPLDAFWKDAMEQREGIRFAYDILNRESPAYGASHDWNAALSAMSMHMDAFDAAFDFFMANKTEEGAQKFAEALTEMDNPFGMARNAIFASNCKRNWQSVKYKYSHMRIEEKNGEDK